MFPTHKKITNGFVIQTYITLPNGTLVCQEQEFIAGDVDYENEQGETISIDTSKEQYCHFIMVQPKPIPQIKSLKFICPACSSNRLECVMDGIHTSEVTNIDESGDFDYGEVQGNGEVDRWQCLECGYVLTIDDENRSPDDQENIINNEDVVEWIKTNCFKEL